MQDLRASGVAGAAGAAGSGSTGGSTAHNSHPSMSLDGPGGRSYMDQSELVGIKDGITLAHGDASHDRPVARQGAEEQAEREVVRLAIKCPSLSDHHLAESSLLTVPLRLSIAEVKQQIQQTWPGRPKAEGMRFFKAGQLLTDDVLVRNIIVPGQADDDDPTVIHLVIRPGAWTERQPNTTRASESSSSKVHKRPVQSKPKVSFVEPRSRSREFDFGTLPALDAEHDESPLGASTASAHNRHLANIVERMDPSQYSSFHTLLKGVYSLHVDQYEEAWMRSYASVANRPTPKRKGNPITLETLAIEMECSKEEVRDAMTALERNVLSLGPLENEMEDVSKKGPYRYKQIHLEGLPYLLRVERNEEEERLKALQKRIDRLRNILHQMEKLINYQSLLDRTMQMPMQNLHVGGMAPVGNADPVVLAHANGGVRPSLTRFSLLQRGDIVSVLIGSLFLTFKLGILIYVFTRGASRTKIALMSAAAFLYIAFGAFKSIERMVAMRRRALRRVVGQGGAQAGLRAADARTAANVGQEAPSADEDRASSTPSGAADIFATEIPTPPAPQRYRAASPFTLDYWIEHIAYYNLDNEDRQIGFRPAEIATRGVAHHPPGTHLQNPVLRYVNENVVLPVILFIATLVPEIEQRRRRAIEVRDNLIRATASMVEEQHRRAREAAEQKANQQEKDDKGSAEGHSQSADVAVGAAAPPPTPALLQCRYSQRILENRHQGRQIDIAQEIEAAAAAAENDEGDNAMDQVDMGFL